MMKQLSEKLTQFVIDSGAISKESYAVYQYGSFMISAVITPFNQFILFCFYIKHFSFCTQYCYIIAYFIKKWKKKVYGYQRNIVLDCILLIV